MTTPPGAIVTLLPPVAATNWLSIALKLAAWGGSCAGASAGTSATSRTSAAAAGKARPLLHMVRIVADAAAAV